VAVIECVATESDDVPNVAFPELNAPVPKGVAPSMKVTVPLGVPAPGATALTVAVNVTNWPNTDGWTEEVTAVVVAAWFTVWVIADEVFPVKLWGVSELPL